MAHGMGTTTSTRESRLPGTLALAGSVLMLLGAALWATTGTDIDRALATGEMSAYLVSAAEHRTVLIANLSIWIVGVLGLGAAGTVMSNVGSGPLALRELARAVYWIAVPLAISAFLAWLALIVQGSANPDPTEVAIAEVVGWYAYRADAVATALIVGAGPALLGSAGRGDWVPDWLFRWGLLAGLAGVLSFLPYYVPVVPLGVSLIIVPVGIGWTLAAAIVLLGPKQTRQRGRGEGPLREGI